MPIRASPPLELVSKTLPLFYKGCRNSCYSANSRTITCARSRATFPTAPRPTRLFSKMALNAASHNIRKDQLPLHDTGSQLTWFTAGEKTGPVTGQPPAPSSDVKKELLESSQNDAMGQSAPGRDGGAMPESSGQKEDKVKSEKERTSDTDPSAGAT